MRRTSSTPSIDVPVGPAIMVRASHHYANGLLETTEVDPGREYFFRLDAIHAQPDDGGAFAEPRRSPRLRRDRSSRCRPPRGSGRLLQPPHGYRRRYRQLRARQRVTRLRSGTSGTMCLQRRSVRSSSRAGPASCSAWPGKSCPSSPESSSPVTAVCPRRAAEAEAPVSGEWFWRRACASSSPFGVRHPVRPSRHVSFRIRAERLLRRHRRRGRGGPGTPAVARVPRRRGLAAQCVPRGRRRAWRFPGGTSIVSWSVGVGRSLTRWSYLRADYRADERDSNLPAFDDQWPRPDRPGRLGIFGSLGRGRTR